MLQNSLSANSAKQVHKTNSHMLMYFGAINYVNNFWNALTEAEVKQRVKAGLKAVLGK